MKLKLEITLGANKFLIESDGDFAEVKPLVETWLAVQGVNPEQLQALVQRLRDGRTDLTEAMRAIDPSPSR